MIIIFNPRHMHRRVTVVVCVCVCVRIVCLSVTTKSAAYLVFKSQTKLYRVLYGVFNVFAVWHSLKMLHWAIPDNEDTPLWRKVD